MCRTAGTTLTSSPPSPLWSETATFLSRPCPPARCRHPPSSNQVRDPLRELKLKVFLCLKTCPITEMFLWLSLFFLILGGSATSSPAMLGIRRHSSNYQRAQSSMQLDTYYGDNSLHKRQYTGLYGVPQGSTVCVDHGWLLKSHLLSLLSVLLNFRVWEENSIFHWDVLLPVRRGFEKVPCKRFVKINHTVALKYWLSQAAHQHL